MHGCLLHGFLLGTGTESADCRGLDEWESKCLTDVVGDSGVCVFLLEPQPSSVK